MTPSRTIYLINQSPALARAWCELTRLQKQEMIKACETAEEDEMERILLEVAHGQLLLF